MVLRRKKLIKILAIFLGVVLLLWLLFLWAIQIPTPQIADQSALQWERKTLGTDHYAVQESYLQRHPTGLWEMFVSGTPFEIGVKTGILTEELLYENEKAFIEGLEEKVPSPAYLQFLKYFVAWFNKDLPDYIAPEYLEEIYGNALYSAPEYDFIADRYHRKLNYHAAHDIGHALQNMGLVGCSALAVWGDKTPNGQIILGRNFDFYVGDAFAEVKMISFIEPAKGIPFATLSWPGFSGVVSGMNTEGLCLSLNAAPSEIPTAAKTPISILAREIIQYASTIDEAVAIARQTPIFISENIVLASAKDRKVVVLELSPDTLLVVEPTQDDYLVCTNHFQSPVLARTESNRESMEKTSTQQRYARMEELVKSKPHFTIDTVAQILRDRQGEGGETLGLGNELAINILIAHHAVLFLPEERQLMVAASPGQMGSYVQYDLDDIFQGEEIKGREVIGQDPLLRSKGYRDFLEFRKNREFILQKADEKAEVTLDFLTRFSTLNPNNYLTPLCLGTYYLAQEEYAIAAVYFKKALAMPIAWENDREEAKKGLETCLENLE